MTLEKKIISFYKYFNEVVRGVRSDYEVSDKEENTVTKFLLRLSDDISLDSVGFDWLFHYFCFQFSYWQDADTGYSKRIQMTWVLGKKAYKRWKDRREDYRFLNSMFAIDSNVKRSELKDIIGETKNYDYEDLRKIEDKERARYHNEEGGLVHCLGTTTLCDEKSEWCQNCKFSKDCKAILRRKFPKIYRRRGYAVRKSIEF